MDKLHLNSDMITKYQIGESVKIQSYKWFENTKFYTSKNISNFWTWVFNRY